MYRVTMPLSCDAVSACVEPPVNLWSPPGLVSFEPLPIFPGNQGQLRMPCHQCIRQSVNKHSS